MHLNGLVNINIKDKKNVLANTKTTQDFWMLFFFYYDNTNKILC